MKDNHSGITVGDLKRQLEVFDPKAWLIFGGGGLDFYRLKRRGEDLVQVEFDQQIYRTEEGELIVEDSA